MSVVGDEIVDDVGVRLVYLTGARSSGSTTLQLVQPLRAGPVRDHLDLHGEGLHHVCFTVASISGMLAGLPDETQARKFRGGRNRPACFLITQPSGTLVELVEQTPSPPLVKS